jgi:hypothetical protein
MQDRYVGDIGDYVKLAILRALSPGRRLGVAWWRFPDSGASGDGRHISYLSASAKWRHLDPHLFDTLKALATSGPRKIEALESANLLADAVYSSELLPTSGKPHQQRAQREAWFARCQAQLANCDLVFLDPDNGLETTRFSFGARSAGKSVSLAELSALRQPGRTLVVYHHQTRRRGGHHAEISHWAARLRDQGFGRVDVLRASPFSPRAFFLLDATDEIRGHAETLAEQWCGMIVGYPNGIHPEPGGTVGDFEFTTPKQTAIFKRFRRFTPARPEFSAVRRQKSPGCGAGNSTST